VHVRIIYLPTYICMHIRVYMSAYIYIIWELDVCVRVSNYVAYPYCHLHWWYMHFNSRASTHMQRCYSQLTFTFAHAQISVHIYIVCGYTLGYVHSHVYIYICTCINIYMYTHIHIYMYIYIYINTYIQRIYTYYSHIYTLVSI